MEPSIRSGRGSDLAAENQGWRKGPDFVLPSADGRPVRLSGYAGHNVLIDFYRGYW